VVIVLLERGISWRGPGRQRRHWGRRGSPG
jgi:hypothetical protein